MSGLLFNRVNKSFGTTQALNDFTLDIQQGEFVSLLGPSGCGKTTALRVAAGFERPDAGIVSVKLTDITKIPAHQRNLGMVFQSYSLFPNLTVGENVAFGLRTRKVRAPMRRERIKSMLELVQLGQLENRYPHQLSGGQQQRVALARALAIEPDVLLLDEPLSALDAHVRRSLRDEIRRLQQSLNTTTLFVTHDQEEALAISDRVGVMCDGRVEQLDTPDSIYHRPTSSFVARFVGEVNEIPASALRRDRLNDGLQSQLVLVRPERVSLEVIGDQNHGIHPIKMQFADCEPNSDRPVGTVVSSSFQGILTTTTVRLDDTNLNIRSTTTQPPPRMNDRVAVVFDLTNAVYAFS